MMLKPRPKALTCLNCRECWYVPDSSGDYVCGRSKGRSTLVLRWGKPTRMHAWCMKRR